jgi:predicted amidohydrolase YtcJ
MLLADARVLTLDPDRPRADAVAVAGGRIVAVGTEAECEAAAPGPRISLGGAVVLPGLVDAHGHVGPLGWSLSHVQLYGCRDEHELVERVARWARDDAVRGRGGWLEGHGWDQTRWPGAAFPTREALSAAVPDRPVWLSRIDGHAGLCNDAALRLAGITRDTPDPPGGRIVRDAAGEPTGVLVDAATALVFARIPPPSDAERAAWILAALERCAAVGLTGVHDCGAKSEDLSVLRRLDEEGRLPIRVYGMVEGAHGPTRDEWLARGPYQGRRLVVRAVKLYLDGALGSRGAALFEPYRDDPGNVGLALLEPERFAALAGRIHRAGFQVAVHAIGDRANAIALDGLAAAGVPPEARPRLEHAQILRRTDLPRIARCGAIASVQPTHATSDAPWVEGRLGAARLAGAYAWRSLRDAGVPLALGSDFPIESPDPREGLYAAITRRDRRGLPPGGFRPEERLTPGEALRGFTAGAAYASFAEAEAGRVAPGYRADLTVLDVDPLADPPEGILEAKTVLVLVDGAVAYRAPGC